MGQQQNDSSSHNPVKTAGSTQTSNGQSDQEDLAANSGRVEKDSMDILLAALQDLNLPATIDRTDQPRKHTEDDVTIVIVSHEAEAWAVFFEGNRQYPGAVLYAFTPFWLSRRPSPADVTIETLYVHKAITAGAGGQTYLDSFTPPRRVTYVLNHVCGSDRDPILSAGNKLTAYGLDIPMSSSMPISLRVNDKLLTRTVCAATDVAHPMTLAFILPGENTPDYPDSFPSIRVVRLLSNQNICPSDVEKSVTEFLMSENMSPFQKVVVKPYGFDWFGSRGVSFHPVSEVKAIVTAVLDLMGQIKTGEGVLVESFYATFDPLAVSVPGRPDTITKGEDLQCRLRVIVCRTPSNRAQMTTIVCGINDIHTPVNGDNSVSMSLELMLQLWGVRDTTQQREIHDVIKQKSERLLLELFEQERKVTVEERGGVGSQLEMVGLDVVLTKLHGVITPVVIEVNGQGCIDLSFAYETTNPSRQGEAACVWVQTMVSRSQRFLMQDKTVLVVGGGQYSKRNLWQDAKDFGVKIVMVDSNPNHLARNQVHHFLHVDTDDHTRDQEHADVIVKRVRSEVGRVDGCVTFWEDCVPLTSLVAEGLGLTHTPSYQASSAAKSKTLTLEMAARDAKRDPAHAMAVRVYASHVARVTCLEDLAEAVNKIPLPAVLKFEFGCGSVGIRHVTTYNEAAEHVTNIPKMLVAADGLGFGDSLVLMPRLTGSEHHIEVVMFEDQLTAAYVVDMGPTHYPLCLQTLAVFPSVLCDESQRQLIAASVACCRALGFTTGVFSVGMMLTRRGPKLLEINARMGGLYTRDFIRTIYDVDLFHLSLMATCGIRPVASNSLVGGYSTSSTRDNSGQLIGLLLYPGRHGNALATTATPERLQKLHDQGTVVFMQSEEEVDGGPHEYESPFATLVVRGATVEETRAKFMSVCLTLGLETEDSLVGLLRYCH